MAGNCLRGSRPVLQFDAAFDGSPQLRLMREMFTQLFQTPYLHPKSKPFVDHVMSFNLVDGSIFFRHYQIVRAAEDRKEEKRMERRGEDTTKLLEIGPRWGRRQARPPRAPH